MRTGALLFSASFCSASDAAPASCSVELDCPAAWMPRPSSHPHSLPPDRSWSARCEVSASFEASAEDETSFDCVTSPPSPLLQMRTGLLLFSAPFCSADEADRTPCAVELSWPATWSARPSEPWQPHDEPC